MVGRSARAVSLTVVAATEPEVDRQAVTEKLAELYPVVAPVIHRRALALLGDEEEALDAVQDIFLKLHGKLATFRGEAMLVTWIYRVTTNHCLNQLRSRRTKRQALQVITRERAHAPGGNGLDRQLERRDLIRRLLGRLSPKRVQILIHQHYDGMTQAEIAEVLGISDRAVRKAIKRANEQLSEELGAALAALREEL